MSARALSDEHAKERITQAVVAAEKLTSAEVVVAIRRHASRYLATSLVLGAIAGLVVFVNLWFSATVYDVRFIPLEVLAVAALVAFIAQSADPIRRRLTPPRVVEAALARGADEAFRLIGVERTRRRNGLLVYAGLFECRVRLVPDIGIDWAALGEPARHLERRLERAVADRDLEALALGLVELGALLGTQYPPTDDDENELCDGPH